MDNRYVSLCAEMAYNDVLMEAYFDKLDESCDESLSEGVFENIKEKVSKVANTILTAIKNFFNKVFEVLSGLIKKIKESAAVKKVKDKIAKLKAKHEAANLYESVLSLVLEADDEDRIGYTVGKSAENKKGFIKYNEVFDHMKKVTEPILKNSYGMQGIFVTKFMDAFNKAYDMGEFDVQKNEKIDEKDIEEAKKAFEMIDGFIEKAKDPSFYGINFKYATIFNKAGDKKPDVSRLADAVTVEFDAVCEHNTFDLEKEMGKMGTGKLNDKALISLCYTLSIDSYANAISDQFVGAKKALTASVDGIKKLEDNINGLGKNLPEKAATAFMPEINKAFRELYNVITCFEKACVASARAFGKIADGVVSQDLKLLANI